MVDSIIQKVSYIGGIAICLLLILWSYIEKDFYSNYIAGNVYLIFSVYILPYIIMFLTILHYFKNR